MARFWPNCFKREKSMKIGTKMHVGVENLNLFGPMQKLMSELFQGEYSFSAHMFPVKMKMSNFSAFRNII